MKKGLEKPASSRKIAELANDLEQLVRKNRDIAASESPNSILPKYATRKEVHQELVKLYNFLANRFGYKTFDHMIAVAHTVLIAEAIAHPTKFGAQNAIKAISQAQDNIRPPEEKAVGKQAEETKQQTAQRLIDYLADPSAKKARPKTDA
jgi:hypothetical protein